MKILLIEPVPPRENWPRGIFRSRWVPTGLASIGRSLLRAGHAVRVHCMEEQVMKAKGDRDASDAALRREIEEFEPDIVGLSMVTPHVPTAEVIAR